MVVLVKEIMSKPAYTIDLNKTIKQAAKIMTSLRKGFLIVTRSNKPVGVISESDILRAIVKGKPTKTKVKEVMSSPIITVSPDTEISEAARKMKRNKIHRLPVIKKGRIVGVISLSDIASTSPELLNLLEERLKMKEQPYELTIKEKQTVGICDDCDNYSENLIYFERKDKWLCETCREEIESEI